jgi:thiol-disulfide isomerase/thioredoxin
LAVVVPPGWSDEEPEEEADMRVLTFLLLAAVIAAGVFLYDMLAPEGEGEADSTTPPPAAAASNQSGSAVKVGLHRYEAPVDPPEVGFLAGSEQNITLADFRGQGVVVNLWATWCAPCVKEMPALDRLQQQVADDNIAVIAVSSDRGGIAAVEPFMKEHDLIALKPYLDPQGAFTQALEGRVLPSTFIINREGKVVARYLGPAEWDQPDMVALVRELTR